MVIDEMTFRYPRLVSLVFDPAKFMITN